MTAKGYSRGHLLPPVIDTSIIYKSNSGGYFKLTGNYIRQMNEEKRKNKILYFEVIFDLTEYTTYTLMSNIKKGEVRDYYHPTLFGLGYIGELKDKKKKYSSLWRGILSRCYNQKDPDYYLYGEKGIYVHPDWFNCSRFEKDLPNLPGYNEELHALGLISIDKDKLGKGYYGSDSCVFLSAEDQSKYSSHPRLIYASKDEEFIPVYNISKFADTLGMHDSSISHCLSGKQKTSKGWAFRYATPEEIEAYKASHI